MVFLDPNLTAGLPPAITASTAMDALAHSLEGFTSNRVLHAAGSTIFSDTYALKGITCIAGNVYQAYQHGTDLAARLNLLIGSTLGGFASNAGSGAAHGLGTPLGAIYHVPHGVAVGMMLPYVMQYNIPCCAGRLAQVAEAFGINTTSLDDETAANLAVHHLSDLMEKMNFPVLKDYIPLDDTVLRRLSQAAAEDKCSSLNAREIGADTAMLLYKRAWNQEIK